MGIRQKLAKLVEKAILADADRDVRSVEDAVKKAAEERKKREES